MGLKKYPWFALLIFIYFLPLLNPKPVTGIFEDILLFVFILLLLYGWAKKKWKNHSAILSYFNSALLIFLGSLLISRSYDIGRGSMLFIFGIPIILGILWLFGRKYVDFKLSSMGAAILIVCLGLFGIGFLLVFTKTISLETPQPYLVFFIGLPGLAILTIYNMQCLKVPGYRHHFIMVFTVICVLILGKEGLEIKKITRLLSECDAVTASDPDHALELLDEIDKINQKKEIPWLVSKLDYRRVKILNNGEDPFTLYDYAIKYMEHYPDDVERMLDDILNSDWINSISRISSKKAGLPRQIAKALEIPPGTNDNLMLDRWGRIWIHKVTSLELYKPFTRKDKPLDEAVDLLTLDYKNKNILVVYQSGYLEVLGDNKDKWIEKIKPLVKQKPKRLISVLADANRDEIYLLNYNGQYYSLSGTEPSEEMWHINMARDFALSPDGKGLYILDAYGGIHPRKETTIKLPYPNAPYWYGKDIARKIIFPPFSEDLMLLNGYGEVFDFSLSKAKLSSDKIPYFGDNYMVDIANKSLGSFRVLDCYFHLYDYPLNFGFMIYDFGIICRRG